MTISRRTALGIIVATPVALMARHAQSAPTVCTDPQSWTDDERGLRQALGYKEKSPDPAKHCGICAFFTGTAASCGTCKLLSGATVDSGSVCDSWAAKA